MNCERCSNLQGCTCPQSLLNKNGEEKKEEENMIDAIMPWNNEVPLMKNFHQRKGWIFSDVMQKQKVDSFKMFSARIVNQQNDKVILDLEEQVRKYKKLSESGWKYEPEEECYFSGGFQFAACDNHIMGQMTCDKCNPLVESIFQQYKIGVGEMRLRAVNFVCDHTINCTNHFKKVLQGEERWLLKLPETFWTSVIGNCYQRFEFKHSPQELKLSLVYLYQVVTKFYVFAVGASGGNAGTIQNHNLARSISQIDFSQNDVFLRDKIIRMLGKFYYEDNGQMRKFPTTVAAWQETLAFIGVSQLFPDSIMKTLKPHQMVMHNQMIEDILMSLRSVMIKDQYNPLLTFFSSNKIERFLLDLARERKWENFGELLNKLFSARKDKNFPEYYFRGKPQLNQLEQKEVNKRMDKLFGMNRMIEGGKTEMEWLCFEQIGQESSVGAEEKMEFVWKLAQGVRARSEVETCELIIAKIQADIPLGKTDIYDLKGMMEKVWRYKAAEGKDFDEVRLNFVREFNSFVYHYLTKMAVRVVQVVQTQCKSHCWKKAANANEDISFVREFNLTRFRSDFPSVFY